MKVLIIDLVNKVLIEKLKANNIDCVYEPTISKEDVSKNLDGYEGVILRNKKFLDKELIDIASDLKFIGRIGSGFEIIDVEYAKNKGIKCFNSPEGVRNSVGEHALAMLLNLLNNLCRSNLQLKNGIWKREANRGFEVAGKTVGIIGYGNTGSAFAKRLSGFEVMVLSYDKYKSNYEDGFTKETVLEQLFEEADIVSLHVPLTEETRYMVDYEFIDKFKKKIFLINTSAGKVVKTDDLANAIRKGLILGAALDVFEYERTSFEQLHFGTMPESLQYLIESDNVIMSPHIAGLTKESDYNTASVLADKIIDEFGSKE